MNESPNEIMLRSYIAAALWSSDDESDDNGGVPMDGNYDKSDIHPDTLRVMTADVDKFLAENAVDIGDRYDQAGHDFWLTRNGHGVGFWEVPDWPSQAGYRLTAACKVFGEVSLYIEAGKVCQDNC